MRSYTKITCITVLAAWLLAGCATTRTIEPLTYYTLDPAITVASGPKTDATLGIRPLMSARPYNLAMAYQRDGHALAYRRHDQWAEQPAAVLTRAIRDSILAADRFADVGLAADMARPDFLLTGEVLKFHEHIGQPHNHAELEVRIEIRKARDVDLLLAQTFRCLAPVESTSPEASKPAAQDAFAKAMNSAIEQFATELGEQIAALNIDVD